MTLFGYAIQDLYLWILIIAAILTVVVLLFGDLLDGIFESIPFLHPVLVLSFFIFLSAMGYILEWFMDWSSLVILIIASISSIIFVTLLHLFVLVPIRSAEQSWGYSEDALIGSVGTAIVSIPIDGYGEVMVQWKSGVISKPAVSYDNEAISQDERVLIIEIKDGVFYVSPYQSLD
ncbi:putative membrane protein YuaF [Oceanobacillus oncorhynchi subsp. incaldanensis]|uniref:NfeD family protein n=2 Tax=Oceanobacillus TaxID=182709 RepID=A0ABV9K4K6_9BACI|nr:NfeD family protein [Oceanobacillus oncorhynchi]UUI38333.1 NfeD family protein [Oceanobacillus oncorhynchi]GIO16940.1 putative membrane protein YuaF [Oceanobacillus oncorhynchi subsp. incaldanensis]CEI84006.1 putative membrane protein YuaF [Oceanobacillus oncorhynchi]